MSLNIPMPTATDMIRMTYLGATKLKEEMSRPGGQPEKLDFSIIASCFNCDGPMSKHVGQKALDLSSGACYLLTCDRIAVGLFSLQVCCLLLQKGASHVAWKSESLRTAIRAAVSNCELENRETWHGRPQGFLREKQGG